MGNVSIRSDDIKSLRSGIFGWRRNSSIVCGLIFVLPATSQSSDQKSLVPSEDPSADYAIQNLDATPYQSIPNQAKKSIPYTMRLGTASARFSAATAFTYTDNALATSNSLGPSDDFVISPLLSTAILWPITELNALQIDVGIGYQKHFVQTGMDALTITPNSSLSWAILLEKIRIALFNRTSTPGELIDRPEFISSGSPESSVFRRISNQSGFSASWIITEDLSLQGGYSFGLDRGLAGSYNNLDRNSHTLSSSLFRRLDPRWTVGLSGSAAQDTFVTGFQNGSQSYSVGVLAAFRFSDNLSLNAGLRQSISLFDNDGKVSDTSDFSGLTYDFQITHQFRPRWSYSLSGGKAMHTGIGSNFTEELSAILALNWAPAPNWGIQANTSYINALNSGSVISLPLEVFRLAGPEYFKPELPGMVDDGVGGLFYFPPGATDRGNGVVAIPLPGQGTDLYQFGITLTHSFTAKFTSSLQFIHALRISDLLLRNHQQNTLSLNLNYLF